MSDAYELGYAVGVREDYSYQLEDVPNVDLPVNILDNDFRDPDLDRYLERFEKVDQLDRWVRNVREEYVDKNVEGLLVANTYRRKPAENRDRGLVSDPRADLQDYGYKFLESVDLFNAIAEKQQGGIDTTGVVDSLLEADIRVEFD